MKRYGVINSFLIVILIILICFSFHFSIDYSKNQEKFRKIKKVIFKISGTKKSSGPLLGKIFDNFELLDVNGKKWQLKNFRSKIKILILFSIFDCSKCLLECRFWNDIHSKYQKEDVQIFGVGYSPNRSTLYSFIREKGIKFPVLHDPTHSVKKMMGFTVTPLRISMDRENRILAIEHPDDSIENYKSTLKKIDDWLKEFQ